MLDNEVHEVTTQGRDVRSAAKSRIGHIEQVVHVNEIDSHRLVLACPREVKQARSNHLRNAMKHVDRDVSAFRHALTFVVARLAL